MRRRVSILWSALVPGVLAVLVLAGCAGIVASADDAASGPTTSETAAISQPAATEPASDVAWTDDQLDALMEQEDLIYHALDDQQVIDIAVAYQEFEAEMEALIATCMRAEGFDYWPIASERLVWAAVDPDANYGTREWTLRYGFGVSTKMVTHGSYLPDGVVGDGTIQPRSPELKDDPNELYRLSLSETDQDAYLETREGPPPGDLGPDNSCRAQGYETLELPAGIALPFDETEAQLDERVQADQRYIDYEREVASCVQAAGFDGYEGIDEAVNSIEAMMDDGGLIQNSELSPMARPEEGLYLYRRSEDQTGVLESGSEAWFAKLAEIQAHELEFALAVYECGGADREMAEVVRPILADVLAAADVAPPQD